MGKQGTRRRNKKICDMQNTRHRRDKAKDVFGLHTKHAPQIRCEATQGRERVRQFMFFAALRTLLGDTLRHCISQCAVQSATTSDAMFHENAFKSMCLVRSLALDHTQRCRNRPCAVVSLLSSALHPNFNNQFHCCRKLMPSQATESEATCSLPSAIVDCLLLDAVIVYQPSLPRNHDAIPLTLNWSVASSV